MPGSTSDIAPLRISISSQLTAPRSSAVGSFLLTRRLPSKEPAHQIHAEKPELDGIPVDPLDEILANKLTAVVGRAEERDLIDILFLERAGYPVESALDAALAKDGGCTPAALAWLLSQIEIPDGLQLPGSVTPAELRAFVTDLVVRLRRAALPEQE